MRRETAAARHRRPAVRQHLHCRLARVHHRLDGEHHPLRQPRPPAPRTVVRNLRLLVERGTNAMPDKLTHDREPVALDVLLDGSADIRYPRARFHSLDAVKERRLGHPEQFRGLSRDTTERDGYGTIAEEPVELGAHVNGEDVSFDELTLRRDPVDHLLVGRYTDGRWIPVVPLERRLRACGAHPLFRYTVDIRRRHARSRHLA